MPAIASNAPQQVAGGSLPPVGGCGGPAVGAAPEREMGEGGVAAGPGPLPTRPPWWSAAQPSPRPTSRPTTSCPGRRFRRSGPCPPKGGGAESSQPAAFFRPRTPPPPSLSTSVIYFPAALWAAKRFFVFGGAKMDQEMGKRGSERGWPGQIWAKSIAFVHDRQCLGDFPRLGFWAPGSTRVGPRFRPGPHGRRGGLTAFSSQPNLSRLQGGPPPRGSSSDALFCPCSCWATCWPWRTSSPCPGFKGINPGQAFVGEKKRVPPHVLCITSTEHQNCC